MSTTWQPGQPEIRIDLDPLQYRLYKSGAPACIYHAVHWPRSVGRSRHGEFPLVVAREHFRQLGYTVWAAEPELPDGDGFILVSYPGKRRRGHPAYLRMVEIFGERVLQELNAAADAQKRTLTGNAGGGDPDLFLSRDSAHCFVEVKWRDRITKKQHVTFPLIEQFCNVEVRIARIYLASQ